MARHAVARIADFPPGSSRIIELERRSVGVYNVNGTLTAINNYCPHQGGPLCRGTVTGVAVADRPYEFNWVRDGEIVRCPWHRWEVDLLSGEVLTDPSKRVKRYAVTVEDGEVVVDA